MEEEMMKATITFRMSTEAIKKLTRYAELLDRIENGDYYTGCINSPVNIDNTICRTLEKEDKRNHYQVTNKFEYLKTGCLCTGYNECKKSNWKWEDNKNPCTYCNNWTPVQEIR
jgi:hypothetical protein